MGSVVTGSRFHYRGVAVEVSRDGFFDGACSSDHDWLDAVGAEGADGSGAHSATEDEAAVGEQFDDAVVVVLAVMLTMMAVPVVVSALSLGVRSVVVGAKLVSLKLFSFDIKNHESHASPKMLREQSAIGGCNCYFHLKAFFPE